MASVSNEQAAQVRSELNRILMSPGFEKAKRSQRFLSYLVDAALSDPPLRLKEYALAVDVFDQPARYDPSVDATVRVEAGRLRNRLRDYYTGLESEPGVLIDLPKGGYSLTFSFKSNAADAHSADAHAGDAHAVDAHVDERLNAGSPNQPSDDSPNSSSYLIPQDQVQQGDSEARPVSPEKQTAQPAPPRIARPFVLTVSALGVVAVLVVLLLTEERTLRRARADLRLEADSHSEVTVTPLTALQGMKFAPTFSPDGSQVAFAWDGGRTGLTRPYDLYAKVIGYEQLRQLTHHPSAWLVPAWSPDGRNIAFVRDGTDDPGVFMISALGGPERKLAASDAEYFYPINLSWSPDGRALAYATRDGMHTVNAESGEIRSIPAPSECPATYDPTFSPDGRWLAFSCYHYINNDLYVLPLGGGAARKVTGVNEISLPIAWSNDSKRIVFQQYERLYEVSLDSGIARPLSFALNGHGPVIAATGERLAFVALSTNVNLWRVNLKPPGKETVSMMSATSAEQSGPDISPDGRRICFSSSRSGSSEVWVSNLDGSDAVQLSHLHAEEVGARWSPDGKFIVIASVKSGESSLSLVDPQVGVLRRIETGPLTTGYAKWSHDAKSIYFLNEQAGTRQGTYKVSIDGGAPQFLSPKLYCNVQEARLGNVLFFMNGPTREAIYARDLSTGVEQPVVGMPKVATAADWALASNGIYFINISGEAASVDFFDFKARRVTRKIPLPKPPVFFGGLALAPDESWLAYSQVDRNDSDLMLAEKFR